MKTVQYTSEADCQGIFLTWSNQVNEVLKHQPLSIAQEDLTDL